MHSDHLQRRRILTPPAEVGPCSDAHVGERVELVKSVTEIGELIEGLCLEEWTPSPALTLLK